MLNTVMAETIARQRQQDLLDGAARARLARGTSSTRRRRLRARAGWSLVHAGMRLALGNDA